MSRTDEQNERIAVLETQVENLTGWMGAVEKRLRAVERAMYIGFGLLIAADAVIRVLFK